MDALEARAHAHTRSKEKGESSEQRKKDFITAGTDQSSPNSGAIDCLLLQVLGSDEGPSGGRSLTKTAFIQRLNIPRTTTPSATISKDWLHSPQNESAHADSRMAEVLFACAAVTNCN